jgi:hypothetical protein
MAVTDKDAIRQLLGSIHAQANVRRVTPSQNLSTGDMADLVLTAFNNEQQAVLHEAEDGKGHGLAAYRMAPADFAAFCAYLVDGGGVADDTTASLNNESLLQILWQAIHDRNQVVFWKELPHLLKSWIKQRGLIVQLTGGGVMERNVNVPLPTPPKFQFTQE